MQESNPAGLPMHICVWVLDPNKEGPGVEGRGFEDIAWLGLLCFVFHFQKGRETPSSVLE